MASPSPTPDGSTAVPKGGTFGSLFAQQAATTPCSSLFGPPTTQNGTPATEGSLFGGITAQQPAFTPLFAPLGATPTNKGLGGFGSPQSATVSPAANHYFPATSSKLFDSSLGASKTSGLGVQKTNHKPYPVNGTDSVLFKAVTDMQTSGSPFVGSIAIKEQYLVPYMNHSVEELRLIDYRQGRRGMGPTSFTGMIKVNDNFDLSAAPSTSHSEIRITKNQAIQLGNSVITIRVDEEEDMQSFTIHEALICSRSKFFKKAMSRNSKETQDKIIDLPKDYSVIFSLYEQILYFGRLPSKPESGGLDELVREYATICKLYVLTEKLQDTDAKRVAIEALLGMSREMIPNGQRMSPNSNHIAIIYYGTSGPCAARRMMVDIYAHRATGSWLQNTQEPFPAVFLSDLAINVLNKRLMTTDTTLTCKVSDYCDTDEGPDEGPEKAL